MANNDNGNNNLETLNEIHKGLVMGMESLSVISEKVGDQNFKDNLDYQYKQYGQILDRVNNLYTSYGHKADDTGVMEKVMGWSAIQMQTIGDKSNSKISEMLIQGNNMGIIKGVKLLNKGNLDNEVRDILDEFVREQENNVEQLKKFL